MLSISVPVQLLGAGGVACSARGHARTPKHTRTQKERESQPLRMMADTDTAMQRDGGGEGWVRSRLYWKERRKGGGEEEEEGEQGEQWR